MNTHNSKESDTNLANKIDTYKYLGLPMGYDKKNDISKLSEASTQSSSYNHKYKKS